jgi:hypothetical protein
MIQGNPVEQSGYSCKRRSRPSLRRLGRGSNQRGAKAIQLEESLEVGGKKFFGKERTGEYDTSTEERQEKELDGSE